ncbi:MAG: tRNA uridine-5-carboxymethylaminomethyl(34) synthesis GTPase MnmE [Clostridiales Family XIII bacterium]|nr:tRNA uridine-5-carboxymethylaminomethyl(34) synthesis GTPase MnmE [Clostridiales Family XIII bacterium]
MTTVAAVSTAYGEGGIGIVRISGDRAGEIMSRLFSCACDAGGVSSRAGFEDRHLYYGHVADPRTDETIDEALFVFMRGPRTYTGEDVAEIQCHGSVASLRRTLEAALGCGAEPASPGEFTQRAFLNGRIDLTQAEAVIDVVRAKTDASARAAVAQLAGGLSARVAKARGLLADALALAAVHIDYPDDDKDFTDPDSAQAETAAILRAAHAEIEKLIATSATGRILREGLNVVIAGAANTGKSSLMNALLRDARSIVTDIPGTTRDSIEERADIRGLTVRLTDTAGIRDTDDEIEQLGMDRTKKATAEADLVVFLIDGSRATDDGDVAALRSVAEALDSRGASSGGGGHAHDDANHGRYSVEPMDAMLDSPPTQSPYDKIIIALSKSDLKRAVADDDIAQLLRDAGIAGAPETTNAMQIPEADRPHTIPISAKTGNGLNDLESGIERAVYGGGKPQSDEPLVTNVRHMNLLDRAEAETTAAADLLKASGDLDLAEINIRLAYDSLGEITGETATDEIIDRIFSRFCIGK